MDEDGNVLARRFSRVDHGAPRPHQLRGLTVDDAARRYVQAMLRAGRQAPEEDPKEAYGEDDWICQGFYDGGFLCDEGPLPTALWFDLIVAAADQALALDPSDQYRLLFGLGDGCSDHLVGEDSSHTFKFHEARGRHPGVEAMFQVMHEDAAGMPWEHTTWWSDGYPDRSELTQPGS
jgi:hypothetical protein